VVQQQQPAILLACVLQAAVGVVHQARRRLP
jgi:hypothetical protein